MSPQRMESTTNLSQSHKLSLVKPASSMNRDWLTKAASGGQAVGQDRRRPEEEESPAPHLLVVSDPRRKGDPEGEHAVQERGHRASSDLPRATLCPLAFSASK